MARSRCVAGSKARRCTATRRRARVQGTVASYEVEQVRINRQGYDSRGKYWGVGEKLYLVVDPSGNYHHIRAKSAKAARNKVQSFHKGKGPDYGTFGVAGARKKRCLKWSKGRKRCLKRAKR